MARTYYTGEAARQFKLSHRHLLRLLKDRTIPEPKQRDVYGNRHWTATELRRAKKILAQRKSK